MPRVLRDPALRARLRLHSLPRRAPSSREALPEANELVADYHDQAEQTENDETECDDEGQQCRDDNQLRAYRSFGESGERSEQPEAPQNKCQSRAEEPQGNPPTAAVAR